MINNRGGIMAGIIFFRAREFSGIKGLI